MSRLGRTVGLAALLMAVGLAPAPSAIGTPASPPVAADRTQAVHPGPGERDPPPYGPTPAPPPPAAPVRLLIPSLGVDVAVEASGIDPAGLMETPRDIHNAGWYRNGPSPGAPGDAVIDGHVGLPGLPLVFTSLASIAVGALVTTVMADGSRHTFRVTSKRGWPADSRPTGLFVPDGPARLSLVTCTGFYDPVSQSYAARLVVDTEPL